MSKGKKLVYVSEDLVQSVLKASRNEGKSVSKFVEEALRRAVETNRLGYDLKKVSELLEVTHTHRILGEVFVPQDILNYLISRGYEAEKEQLQAKWFESGRWHGKYLKEKFEKPVQALKRFLEATTWNLSEVEVKQEENKVKLRCISTLLTTEVTELLTKFIEGAMHGIGYETEKTDCVKGMIILEFKS